MTMNFVERAAFDRSCELVDELTKENARLKALVAAKFVGCKSPTDLLVFESKEDLHDVGTSGLTKNGCHDHVMTSRVWFDGEVERLKAEVKMQGDGLRAEIERLKAEIETGDKIIAQRNRLLDLFECKAHGSGCVPNAIEEVERLKAKAEAADLMAKALELVKIHHGSFLAEEYGDELEAGLAAYERAKGDAKP